MKDTRNFLVTILGPTASGKTNVAIELAKHFGTGIISADSRQFYKEIPIGTATPDKNQLQQAKHYFIGHLSITEDYNVSRFESEALTLLDELYKSTNMVIMTGGSGLYINAVCQGIDLLPDPEPELRGTLNRKYEEEGLEGLQQQLKFLDPEFYDVVDRQNPKRLMRAIEVCLQTGKPYSSLRLNQPKDRSFKVFKLGLEVPRDILNTRIDRRTEEMIRNGWLEEARAVYALRDLNALNTVGFKELFKYFDGEWDLDTAIQKIKTNTRRYAKRQMTWFRKDPEIHWFKPEQLDEMKSFITLKMSEK